MIYWRLLSTVDPAIAQSAVLFNKTTVASQGAKYDPAVLEELIANMGTVAGVLHVVPSDFVKRVKYLPEEVEEDAGEANEVSRAWKKVEIGDPFLDLFADWAPMTLWLKVVNKAPNPIGAFAIAFDKNWAGLTLTDQPQFPPEIDFGESCEIPIPLTFSERTYRAADASPLRAALRVAAETKVFTVPIDATAVVLDAGRLTDQVLKEAWGMYTSEFQVEVPGILPTDQAYAARNVRVCSRVGTVVTMAFILPPNRIYICKVQEIERKLLVLVHGDSQLFDVIRSSAESIFS
jgi:hypothetical protein